MKSQQGFTLLEVLVALMILSVTLTAIFYALIEDSRITQHLETKTYAHWIAQNEIANYQLQAKSTKAIPQGTEGTTTLFARQWSWSIRVISNNSPYYTELEIEVRPDKQKAATSLQFFLRKHHDET